MDAAVLALSGEIDVAAVAEIRERLFAAIAAQPGTTLRVGFDDVEFIDSTGLGVLVGAQRRARDGGGELVLAGLRPNVAKVFSITGLDKVFTIEP